MTYQDWGALCFGFVIGWICYRTLRRTKDTSISDLATVIGAIGGGSVIAIFQTPELFAGYSIGLLVGFVLYLIVSAVADSEGAKGFMKAKDPA